MTETIKKCDCCGEKVNWLYTPPRMIVEGLNLNEYNGKNELCEKCMRSLCQMWNNPKVFLERGKDNA